MLTYGCGNVAQDNAAIDSGGGGGFGPPAAKKMMPIRRTQKMRDPTQER